MRASEGTAESMPEASIERIRPLQVTRTPSSGSPLRLITWVFLDGGAGASLCGAVSEGPISPASLRPAPLESGVRTFVRTLVSTEGELAWGSVVGPPGTGAVPFPTISSGVVDGHSAWTPKDPDQDQGRDRTGLGSDVGWPDSTAQNALQLPHVDEWQERDGPCPAAAEALLQHGP